MVYICEHTPVYSAASMAGDLYPNQPIAVLFTEQMVEELNQAGLVYHREGPYGAVMHVRPTKAGYDAVGYAPAIRIFGPRKYRHPHLATGPSTTKEWFDWTNFMRHDEIAVGSPVARETLADHMVMFPSHIHPWPEQEGYLMARPQIAAEKQERIRALKKEHPDWGYLTIAREVGVSDNAVRAALKRAYETTAVTVIDPGHPKVRVPDGQSTRNVLLFLIDKAGPWEDAAAITREVRTVYGLTVDGHNITHLLFDLRRDGKITFRESNGSDPGAMPTRIEITTNGRAQVKAILNEAIWRKSHPEPDSGTALLAADLPSNGRKKEEPTIIDPETARVARYVPTAVVLAPEPPAPPPAAPLLAPARVMAPPVTVTAPVPAGEWSFVADDSKPVTLDDYPLIKAICASKNNDAALAKAAAILEEAGLDEEALSLMERKSVQTPLEAEVLALAMALDLC